jgi:hypothetical protein
MSMIVSEDEEIHIVILLIVCNKLIQRLLCSLEDIYLVV